MSAWTGAPGPAESGERSRCPCQWNRSPGAATCRFRDGCGGCSGGVPSPLYRTRGIYQQAQFGVPLAMLSQSADQL